MDWEGYVDGWLVMGFGWGRERCLLGGGGVQPAVVVGGCTLVRGSLLWVLPRLVRQDLVHPASP